jgi:hypothetical protein
MAIMGGLAIAGLVTSIYGMVSGAQAAKAEAKSRKEIRETNAAAANTVRDGNNILGAAKGNLSRWIQSVNNNKLLASGANSLEEAEVNFRRQRDASLSGDFARQIQVQEQAGIAAASRGFSGGIGVAAMVGASTALRGALIDQGIKNVQDQQGYDQARRVGHIQSQMIGGLDNSVILDTLDVSKNVTFDESAPTGVNTAQAIQLLGQGLKIGAGFVAPTPPVTDHFAFNLSTAGVDTGLLGSFPTPQQGLDVSGASGLYSGSILKTTPQF